MSTSDRPELDPVIAAALEQLRSFTYETGDVRARRLGKRRESLSDRGPRAGAIHIFKHLKHHGYDWQPEDVQTWAESHGWDLEDAGLLKEYAAGIRAGIRYHTAPDPFGRGAIERWREQASKAATATPPDRTD